MINARWLTEGDVLEIWGRIEKMWRRNDGRIRIRFDDGSTLLVPSDRKFTVLGDPNV